MLNETSAMMGYADDELVLRASKATKRPSPS